MKKLLFALIAFATLSLSSCSKETRINNKLDGSWNITQYSNNAVPSGSTLTMNFDKGKKGAGTGSLVGTGFLVFANSTFTYQLTDDKLVTITGTGSTASSETYTVTEYSSKNVTLTEADGTITKLEAK